MADAPGSSTCSLCQCVCTLDTGVPVAPLLLAASETVAPTFVVGTYIMLSLSLPLTPSTPSKDVGTVLYGLAARGGERLLQTWDFLFK
jgi:hypothetical protein